MPTGLIDTHPLPVIVVLVLAGALCHLAAWTELDEYHWMDIFMRGLPFEDLTPRGQLLEIVSWILAAFAVILLVVVYLLPRLPLVG